MRFFRNLSIRNKLMLITMIVSMAALMIASGMFLAKDVTIGRRQLLAAIGTDAEMVSRNSTAALSFQNQGDAAEILSRLRRG